MSRVNWMWFAIGLTVLSLLAISFQALQPPASLFLIATATPAGRIATEAELADAYADWVQSAHADTYDKGLGANTTCARCKSPFNWDPFQSAAQEEALDCAACKRVPGAPRPKLTSGVVVDQADWQNIPCNGCHEPVGESYYVVAAFWNQATGTYEEVEDSTELCAHCHEGQHGFEVIAERQASQAHTGMKCTDCHGAHGSPSTCQDCHDPADGAGAAEHTRHPTVNCTACHDAGNLSIWYESDPSSPHTGEYITRRFAHDLTSWPSHNLQVQTRCERCHHPQGEYQSILAEEVSCLACHPDGAVIFWCENFPRNLDLNEPEAAGR